METERITGKVIHIHPKGWGFISSASRPFTRIFFHWSGLVQSTNFTELKKGMIVSFECVDYIDKRTEEKKGLRALKIEVEK